MAKLRIRWDLWMEIIRALSLKMEHRKVTIGVVLAVMETCVIPSTLSKCHIAKYKTLEEKQNLVLTSPEGEKRWPLPFQKPKNWPAEKRTSSKRWGRKWHKTAAARETYRISWGHNQSSWIVVRWEPVKLRRNKPKSVWSLILWATSLLPKPHFMC